MCHGGISTHTPRTAQTYSGGRAAVDFSVLFFEFVKLEAFLLRTEMQDSSNIVLCRNKDFWRQIWIFESVFSFPAMYLVRGFPVGQMGWERNYRKTHSLTHSQ